MSLKAAAELLTGAPCYHMDEVFRRDDAARWCRIFDGEIDLVDEVLDGCVCAIDWPVSSLWLELSERYPDAVILLSHRGDAATWWRSADATVWEVMRGAKDVATEPWWQMTAHLQRRFAEQWDEPASAKAAYEAHVSAVREAISPERLIEYVPGDGWGPLCAALGMAVPDNPFPYRNTRREFIERNRGSA